MQLAILRSVLRPLCAVIFALAVSGPRLARADDDVTEMARQRFREGVQFYDQRQYEKARLAFLQSYAIKPHPATLLNLAQSELRAGRPDDAANHFSEYLRTNSGANESEKQEAELGFTAAKTKVGEVTIAIDATGAQVSVDGQEKGTSPLPGPLYLAPGNHAIEARSNDRTATKTVSVAAGQATSVTLSFRAAAAAPPPAAAGGGPSPESAAPATPSQPETATEQPTEEGTPTTSGETTSGGRLAFFPWLFERPLAIVLAAVAVGGAGTSVVTGLMAKNNYDNANQIGDQIVTQRDQDAAAGYFGPQTKPNLVVQYPCSLSTSNANDANKPEFYLNKTQPQRFGQYADACQKVLDNSDKADKLKTVSITTGAIAGAALVGTVVYYFVDSKPAAGGAASDSGKPWARIVPWGSPASGGGFAVYGQF